MTKFRSDAALTRLDGNVRTGIWVRRQNWSRRLDVLRVNSGSFLGAVLVGGLVITIITLIVPSPFLRGLIVGVGASTLLTMFGYLTLAISGTLAPGMGATAETWTAAEFRRLRKRGWRTLNGLMLEKRDVDHVLVGPGGVIVAETKWSARAWQLTPPDQAVRTAVDQAQANAKKLQLWHPVKTSGVPVHALLVLWGGAKADRSPDPIEIGGTTVVYGKRALRRWLDETSQQPCILPVDQRDDLWRQFTRHVTARELHDPSAAPPFSFDRIVWTSLAAVISFAAAPAICLEAWTLFGSWQLALACIVLQIALGLSLPRRWPITRIPVTGALAGLATISTITAIKGIVTLVR